MKKKTTIYVPNKELTDQQKTLLKENSNCEIKHTVWYKCGFLNFLESEQCNDKFKE